TPSPSAIADGADRLVDTPHLARPAQQTCQQVSGLPAAQLLPLLSGELLEQMPNAVVGLDPLLGGPFQLGGDVQLLQLGLVTGDQRHRRVSLASRAPAVGTTTGLLSPDKIAPHEAVGRDQLGQPRTELSLLGVAVRPRRSFPVCHA